MANSGLLGLALVVILIFASIFLFKKSIRAFFSMQIKHQAIGVALTSVGLALITPAGFVNSLLAWSILSYGFWGYIQVKVGGFKGGSGGSGDVVRGNQLYSQKAVLKMLAGEESNISIGSIPIPKRFETRHFLAAGTTGAGKTMMYQEMLHPIRARGERAIVPDVGGENLSIHYRAGDVILNPFDSRDACGKGWSPLSEMRGKWDGMRIAQSMIPDGQGQQAEWCGYAQKILSAVLIKTWEADGNNGEILRWCVTAPLHELRQFLAGTPVEGMFSSVQDDGSAKGMITEVRGILSSYIDPLQYLDPKAGGDAFSIRDFMKENGSAWLFIPFADAQFKTLKPLIAAWMDICISGLLDLEEDEHRRIWFLIDEFATFGEMGSLEALLTRGRRYGGCGVLGVQTIAQIFDSYGDKKAQTLLSCLGTQVILRCPDALTSDAFSKLFGEQDIRRVMHATSHSGSDVNHSQSVQYTTQRTVLASEIQNLPDLAAYLNVVGDIPPTQIVIPITKKLVIAERFSPKPRKAKAETDAEAVAA